MKKLLLVQALVLAVFFANTAWAGILRVEKDGTGDFLTLQPAADAAANGDTILIGPGFYSDLAVESCFGPTEHMMMNIIGLEKLTIIGSGTEETIIGREVYDYNTYYFGILAYGYCGASSLIVKNICFKNFHTGIFSAFSPDSSVDLPTSLIVEDCLFINNRVALTSDGNQIRITNCISQSNTLHARFFWGSLGAPIENIIIDGVYSNTTNEGGSHIGLSSFNRFELKNSTFIGGATGVFAFGGEFIVSNSSFNCSGSGIGAYASINTISDCIITGPDSGVSTADTRDSIIQVERTVFSEIGRYSYGFSSPGEGSYFRDCIIEKGELWAVEHSTGWPGDPNNIIHIDMTDNWWGTADPDSIQAMIEDGMHDPSIYFIVDWDPYKDEPVPNEKENFGGIKSIFR